MAFFSKAYRATEFVAIIYDLSDRGRQAMSFPIMPNQRSTQILASGFSMTKDAFPVEHKYRLVVSLGGRILAETTFAIKETKVERAARKAKEKALRRQSVDF
jgi:sulfur relay (sulfurtransferase) DsrF/TusC family protein